MKAHEVIEGFDCLEFKAQAQERLRQATAGMSPREELSYLRKTAATGPFAELWSALPTPGESPDESQGGAPTRRN